MFRFTQEYRASVAVAALRQRVASKVTVLRDGAPISVPSVAVVPGDVVLLSAGSLVPADGVLLAAKDFFVSEAVLTGETFPMEKALAPRRPWPVSPNGTTASSWAPPCAAARRRRC